MKMRDILTKKEISRLNEVGFAKADGNPVKTLADLLETLPDELVIFTRRLEYRWEPCDQHSTVKPAYWACLEINKKADGWEALYSPSDFINPELQLRYYNNELIVVLYQLAIILAAPSDRIEKRILGHLPKNEEDYRQMLERIKNENDE